MKRTITILLVTSVIIFTGCYRDIEEELYPPTGNCDTTAVTYTTTVVPLLQSNGCLGCHSGGAPSGNISLDNYNSVKLVAQNGKLYGAISHSPGYPPMPQGGNKLSTCNISKIKAWIDAGSPNN